jgi:Zn-dependent protease
MFLSAYYLLALILILTVHEAAHAWVAMRLGDPTAQRAGRVSLNPIRHLSFLGTIMLFIVGIGWGKPVPINPRNFKNPMRDQAITAIAGPAANLLLAVLAAIPISYLPETEGTIGVLAFCEAVMLLSLVLFVFNMIPVPPLDGSKFLGIFVPKQLHMKYFSFLNSGMPYFMALLILDLYFIDSLLGYSLIWKVVSTVTYWMMAAILAVV